MAGKAHGLDARLGVSHDTYGDTVTITLPRGTARDLYYALSLAMGGSPPYGEPAWAPSGGKGKGKGRPKPVPKPKS
jgi:hypothetical protein